MSRPVVGIGEILFDLLPQGPQLGGAPANFAYHVMRLGGCGYAVSAIGRDELGERIKSILAEKELDSEIPEVDCPTGVVEVTLDDKGVPSYNIIQGVAWDNVPYTEKMKSLAKDCAAVCFGTLAQRSETSRATIKSFLADTPEDCLKVYDINLRQHYYSKELVCESLESSDILKINDEEIVVVSKLLGLSEDPTEACRQIIGKYGLKLAVLTKGADGSDVITLDAISSKKPLAGKIADTVGAGDSFTAAFVQCYLKGMPIEKAHEIANQVSSYVCTKSGAMPEYDESILTKIN